jgi:hypothetical protein
VTSSSSSASKEAEEAPPPKLAYEKTNKELDQSVRQELEIQIFKVKEPQISSIHVENGGGKKKKPDGYSQAID